MKQSSAIFALFVCLSVKVERINSVTSPGSHCDATNLYRCPNCGGIEVSDCLQCDGYLNRDQNHGICYDRKLFNKHVELDHDYHYPHLLRDILGAFIWFVVAGVATACGVGGGGIYVPLGIILLRFASKPASGLSQASIFGASLGGFLINIRSHHPNKNICDTPPPLPEVRDTEERRIIERESKEECPNVDHSFSQHQQAPRKFYTRPLIDYDMALFLAPMEMAGAVMGVIIQKLMPNWLFLSLAAVILGLTSVKTFQKFRTSYRIDRENREASRLGERKKSSDDSKEEEQGDVENTENLETAVVNKSEACDLEVQILYDQGKSDNVHSINTEIHGEFDDPIVLDEHRTTNGITFVDNDETLAKRRKFLEEDSRQYPAEKLAYLVILWIGLALITFLKGGKGVQSLLNISCASPWYPVLIVLQFLWTIGFALIFGFKLVKNHKAKIDCNYPFLENDVLWDAPKLRFYASFTFIAGIVAGLIGIGGGMVLGPLMLVMGIHPRVSSATTATMIVLTSSSVAIMFVTSGLVPWEYALFFFCVCFSGASVGKKYIDSYVKRTGMSSILIGILATIIALATIGCFVIVLLNLSKADWCLDGFKKFCDINDFSDDLTQCSIAGTHTHAIIIND